MENKKKRISWLSVEAFLFVFVFLAILFFQGSTKIAESATTYNVAGWAWSSNFGWISMNCSTETLDWYDPSWLYRSQITINSSKVGGGTEDETDFPVLISLSGLSNINANGTDIRFTTGNGKTLLPREIEYYSGGTLVAWVKIPTLSHTVNTVIYMYYGNSSATEPAPNSTYGSQNVWTNGYRGVWHLPNGTTLTTNDSTSNSYNGTNHNATSTTGQLDGGAWAGNSSYTQKGYITFGTTLPNPSSDFTFSFWANPNGINAGGQNSNVTFAGETYTVNGFRSALSSTGFDFWATQSGGTLSARGGTVTTGKWDYWTIAYSGTTASIYEDGIFKANGSGSYIPSAVNMSFDAGTGGVGWFWGNIDEVRLSSSARSAGWISTEYNNQFSPGTFYSVVNPDNGVNSCSQNGGYDYGVEINPGSYSYPFNFDGYAWSPNAGWIKFRYDGGDPNPPDNYKFNTNCLNNCSAGSNCTACFNPNNGKIYGWARVVNQGSDGWIALGATSTSPGVIVDQTSASGTFTGWAWNGSTDTAKGLGWIRFNCNNPGYTNQCGTSSYAVYLKGHQVPNPSGLSAPNWGTSSACAISPSKTGFALNAILKWNNTGYTPTYYDVIVSTSTNTSTPPAYNSGKRGGAVSSFVFQASSTNTIVRYGKAYYWWVRVWDDFGLPSGWRKFDASVGDNLTDNNALNASIGNANTFSTYLHEMPLANFTYVPPSPLAYDPVTTTDKSFYFTSASPYTPVACNKANCGWYWTGGSSILSNSATTSSSTVMTFRYSTNTVINLKIKDIGGGAFDNYSCISSTPSFLIDIFPSWKEKKTQ